MRLGWLVPCWLAACQPHSELPEDTPTFDATRPLRKDVEVEREYVAQIRAIQHIEVRALERGYLQDIYVDEGQDVEEDQLMFQLMPMIYQAEVRKSQAEVDLANIDHKNAKLLHQRDIVSQTEVSLAKAKVDGAKAELDLAQTHQRLAQIHAPFSAIMGRFSVRKGSLVEEGDLLTTLADVSQVWVYFNVSETEYLNYKTEFRDRGSHEPVSLIMANGKAFAEEGQIDTIEADFNNETGNIAFRATFLNPDALLRHGGTGTIVRRRPYPEALIIPQKATYGVLDRRFVFVVDDGVVRSREISIAAELPYVYVIKDGLEEDDIILLEGLRRVRDGSDVDVDVLDPAEVIDHLGTPAQ